MTLYQIEDWDVNFENAGSRGVERCSWCPVPNKQDGLGYTLLTQGRNGAARYGAFVAILMVASKQKKPREGWLTDNGRSSGRPLSAYQLSLKTKLPERIIEETLLRVSQSDIGWIIAHSSSSDSTLIARHQQPDSVPEQAIDITEGNRTEQKEERKAGIDTPAYLTYKSRRLTGFQLEGFEEFWKLWRHPRYGTDKSRAADSWMNLPWPDGNKDTLENRIYKEKILYGARRFVEERDAIIELGDTPKYAQGWLSERRFETYADSINEKKLRVYIKKQMGAEEKGLREHELPKEAADD